MENNEQLTAESQKLYDYVYQFTNKYPVFKKVHIIFDRQEKHWILNMPFDDGTTDTLRCYGRTCDEILDAVKDLEARYDNI